MSGWRNLQIDGANPESFEISVNVLLDELPYARREIFSLALAKIWDAGLRKAETSDIGYFRADFIAGLDGLRYEQIIDIADAEEPGVSDYQAARNRRRAPITDWRWVDIGQ